MTALRDVSDENDGLQAASGRAIASEAGNIRWYANRIRRCVAVDNPVLRSIRVLGIGASPEKAYCLVVYITVYSFVCDSSST